MNSKTGIIIAAIVVVVLLGIGGFVYATKFMAKNQTPYAVNNSMMGNTAKSGSVFSSIQEALSKNLTLQCDIKDTEGRTTTSYIKNGMIRVNVTGKTPEEEGTVIMRDSKMYFWNSKSAIMMAFDVNEIQKNAANAPTGTQNPQDYMTMMEKYKNDCKTAVVSDSLFVVPTNVKFQDFSQMMKNLQNSAGSNSTTPAAGSSAQYEELMKQYAQPSQP